MNFTVLVPSTTGPMYVPYMSSNAIDVARSEGVALLAQHPEIRCDCPSGDADPDCAGCERANRANVSLKRASREYLVQGAIRVAWLGPTSRQWVDLYAAFTDHEAERYALDACDAYLEVRVTPPSADGDWPVWEYQTTSAAVR